MRKVVAVLLLGFSSVRGYSEYWGELEIEKSLNEKLNFEIDSRVMFGSTLRKLYGYRTQVGPVFQINEFIESGLYFKNEEVWREGKWQNTINSLSLFAGLHYVSPIFHISDRNRIDYYDFRVWRYRNLFRIRGFPYVIYEKSSYYGEPPIIYRIAPCLEEEFFFNINGTNIDENRLLLGIYFEIIPYMSFKLGYMLHSKKGQNTKGTIVSTLEFTFLEIE